jgi:fermentation-respiration switch protein FrsA (DUF1100 family)
VHSLDQVPVDERRRAVRLLGYAAFGQSLDERAKARGAFGMPLARAMFEETRVVDNVERHYRYWESCLM